MEQAKAFSAVKDHYARFVAQSPFASRLLGIVSSSAQLFRDLMTTLLNTNIGNCATSNTKAESAIFTNASFEYESADKHMGSNVNAFCHHQWPPFHPPSLRSAKSPQHTSPFQVAQLPPFLPRFWRTNQKLYDWIEWTLIAIGLHPPTPQAIPPSPIPFIAAIQLRDIQVLNCPVYNVHVHDEGSGFGDLNVPSLHVALVFNIIQKIPGASITDKLTHAARHLSEI